MISINIKGSSEVSAMLAAVPKQANRAAEMAIDFTAKFIKADVQREMLKVFNSPTPYTMNSLMVTPTRNHNMTASVWFKEPQRMGQHYLVPQVAGGRRQLKGFERALDAAQYVPGRGAKLDTYGNIRGGDIVQILSVLGRLNRYAGDNTNISAASKVKNKKERDYLIITKRRGKVYPGVYQRVQTGVGFGAKTKRTFLDQSKAYQKGRTRGRFSAVIMARGIKPILLRGRTGKPIKPLLDFYGIADATYKRVFAERFWSNWHRMASR